uniref:pirin family protein n=1 Tax=Acinetobacter guillouiae TaxID=106649 RepID=UPI00300BC554
AHWVGDGFPVRGLFSYSRFNQSISPFLLLDYAAPFYFEPTTAQLGVGTHPHRGFETVTIAYQGEVEHKDSSGGGGTIKTGDVQWMTAGAGLVHEEFHSQAFAKTGGVFEMVQLWVNLPAKYKMTAPKYQAIEAQDIPLIELENDIGHLRVIAGKYIEHVGPAYTFSPMNVWDVRLKLGHKKVFNVPADHNTIVVMLSGESMINGAEVNDSSMVLFENDSQTEFEFEAVDDTHFLILSGEPLNENIEGYGPFVMNSQEEISQAVEDFNSGKFGKILKA